MSQMFGKDFQWGLWVLEVTYHFKEGAVNITILRLHLETRGTVSLQILWQQKVVIGLKNVIKRDR